MSSYIPDLIELIYVIPAVLIAFTLHEYAHAYVSYILGDLTPKLEGRLTLNPFAHLDLFGCIILILFKFGWAKPVIINPLYFKKPKRDMGLVAFAGPLMNFFLAFISIIIFVLLNKYFEKEFFLGSYSIHKFLYVFSMINIGLGVFNMIPIPPLDGSKVLGAFLPYKIFRVYMMIEPYGMVLLLFLIFTNLLSPVLNFLIDIVLNNFQIIINWILIF